MSPSEIKSDLASGTAIVRTKESTAGAPTGSTDDTVLKTMVKGKLQADSQLAKANIDAEAKSGEVTLTGSAEQPEAVGRAIALALDTQGVTKVTSEIKVSESSSSGASSTSGSGSSSSSGADTKSGSSSK